MIYTRWLLTAGFKMAFVKFLSQNERNCEDCSTRLDLEKFCKLQIIKPRGRRLAKSFSRLIVSSRNAVGCGFYQYISNYVSISGQKGEIILSFRKNSPHFQLAKKTIVFSFTRFKNDLLANLIYYNSTDMAFL